MSLYGARPNLVLLIVLGWAAVRGEREGLLWGFFGGLMIDLLSGGPLGAAAIALVIVALVAAQPWGEAIGVPAVRVLTMALIGALAYHAILLLALGWSGHTVHWGFALTRIAIPSAILNALLTPVAHLPLSWVARRLRREGLTL